MPSISVSLPAGDILSYEIAFDLTVLDLKGFINAETDIPIASQRLSLHGRPLINDAQTLQNAGVTDHDMLAISVANVSQPRSQATPRTASQGADDRAIENIRQQVLGNARARADMARQVPDMARSIEDPVLFRQFYRTWESEQLVRQRESDARIARLNDDVNEENQAAIAEQIRQENIELEYVKVSEENPELMASVTMLYVNIEVNGHPVKAFVDSGAQATVMSPDCAEACNVTRLIDKRFAGIAIGVGTAKILGRVHRANIKIGDAELPCGFTVMEGKDVDLLFGLDMLKRYQATIDLYHNRLTFQGGVSVPFLPESEIPKRREIAMDEEPIVEGPDGMAIGAVSGAVKPTSSAPTAADPGPSSSNFSGAGRTIGTIPSPIPRPSAPTPGHAAPEFPEESIEMLIRLGATRPQAIEALRVCQGNVEVAAGMLMYD